MKRRADGKSRWFGFVTFTSAEAAEQVVLILDESILEMFLWLSYLNVKVFAMPSHVIDGRTVEIRRATSQVDHNFKRVMSCLKTLNRKTVT